MNDEYELVDFGGNLEKKVFVGNISYHTIQSELEHTLEHLEGYVKCDLAMKYNSNLCRGFGFITFVSNECVSHFLNSDPTIILKNRKLRFCEYTTMTDKNLLFIKNLPSDLSSVELKTIFQNYGKIGICFINTNNLTGKSKQTGVVEIIDSNMFKHLLNICTIDVTYKSQNIQLSLSRFIQKIKSKKNISLNDIYQIAYNAGKYDGYVNSLIKKIE